MGSEEIKSKIFRQSSIFTFTLTIFFGSLWFYFLNFIKELTTNNPSDTNLFFLSFLHYLVFVYFLIALILFYETGLQLVEEEKVSVLPTPIIKFLFSTWPVVLVGCCVSYVLVKFFPPSYNIAISLYTPLGLALFTYFASKKFQLNQLLKELKDEKNLVVYYFSFFVISLFFFYLVIMSCLFADIEIQTDKEFYTSRDNVLVSVASSGYLFNPDIKKISYGNSAFPLAENVFGNRIVIEYPLKSRSFLPNRSESYGDFIRVDYKQANFLIIDRLTFTKYYYVKIADKFDPYL